MHEVTHLKKKYVPIYQIQYNKKFTALKPEKETKIYAFRNIFVCSAKAYVNQFLSLPNAMCSYRLYLY
jgi:hypothetical protein